MSTGAQINFGDLTPYLTFIFIPLKMTFFIVEEGGIFGILVSHEILL
jgi:hypothetical protein